MFFFNLRNPNERLIVNSNVFQYFSFLEKKFYFETAREK